MSNSKLIEELKEEHKNLNEKLLTIREHGCNSDKGKKVLFEYKNTLLAHLKKEDKELYPPLVSAAETDSKIKIILEIFADEINIVSKKAINFFDKYSQDYPDKDFNEDASDLIELIKNRINKEENLLFIKYEELDEK